MKNSLVWVSKSIIYILVGLTPLMYIGGRVYPHITSKTFFFQGLVLLLTSLFIYICFLYPEYRPNKKIVLGFLPVLLFIGWLTLAGILGEDPYTSFWSSLQRGDGIILWYHVLAFAFILANFIKVHKQKFVRSIFLLSLCSSFIVAMLVWLGYAPFFFTGDALGGGGTIGNESFAGAYILFNFFAGGFLLFDKEFSKSNKWLVGSLMFLMLLSPLFVSFTDVIGKARGATIGIGLGAIFAGLTWLSFSKKKLVKVLGIVGVSLFLLGGIFIWKTLEDPSTKLHQSFISVASETRFIFGDIAKKSIKENPIFGTGSESYAVVFLKNFQPKMLLKENNTEGFTDRTHNVIFDIGVSGGIPAIVFYFVFLFSVIYFFILAYRKGDINSFQASLLVAAIVGYFIQNLFVFDSLVTLLMVAVFLGVSVGLGFENTDDDNKKARWRLSEDGSIILIIVLLILFTFSWINLSLKPVKKARLISDVYSAGLNKRPDLYSKLLNTPKIGDMYDIGSFSQSAYVLYVENRNSLLQDDEKRILAVKDIIAYLDYGDAILKENPKNYRLALNLSRLGNVLLVLVDPSSDISPLATKIFEWGHIAEGLAPTDPQVYWSLGQTSVFTGDMVSAREYFQKSVDLEPRIEWGHRLLVALDQQTGNKKMYEQSLKRAKEYFPDFDIDKPASAKW